MSHSATLVLAYAAACLAWWLVSRVVPLWRAPVRPTFAHPWREVALALLAAFGVLGLGLLWSRGIRFDAGDPWQPAAESVNQMIIFAPLLLLPALRRDWSSAWVQPDRPLPRLAVGVVLAMGVLFVHSLGEPAGPGWLATVREVAGPAHAHLAVQVLLEDLAIAILFVRLAAALSPGTAVLLVAALFAAGHVPAMVTEGASASDYLGLVRDFGLGVLVIGTLWRGADVLWFWPVHFSLDMTQFLHRAG